MATTDDSCCGLTDDSASSCPTSHNDSSCNSCGDSDTGVGGKNKEDKDSESSGDDAGDEPPDDQHPLELNKDEKKKEPDSKPPPSTYKEFKETSAVRLCCNKHALLLACGYDGVGKTGQCGMMDAKPDDMDAMYKEVINKSKQGKDRDKFRNIEEFALSIVNNVWSLRSANSGRPASPPAAPKKKSKSPRASGSESESGDKQKLGELLPKAVDYMKQGAFDMARGELEKCQQLLGDNNSKKLLETKQYLSFEYCYIKTLIQSEAHGMEILNKALKGLEKLEVYLDTKQEKFILLKLLRAEYYHKMNSSDDCKRTAKAGIEQIKDTKDNKPLFFYPSLRSAKDDAIEESKPNKLRAEFERLRGYSQASQIMECCAGKLGEKCGHRRTKMLDGDPDCSDYVTMQCTNAEKCSLEFHSDCWDKILKNRDLTQKDVDSGDGPCPTPDCGHFISDFVKMKYNGLGEFAQIAAGQSEVNGDESEGEKSQEQSNDQKLFDMKPKEHVPIDRDAVPLARDDDSEGLKSKDQKKKKQKKKNQNLLTDFDIKDDKYKKNVGSTSAFHGMLEDASAPKQDLSEEQLRSRTSSGVSSVDVDSSKQSQESDAFRMLGQKTFELAQQQEESSKRIREIQAEAKRIQDQQEKKIKEQTNELERTRADNETLQKELAKTKQKFNTAQNELASERRNANRERMAAEDKNEQIERLKIENRELSSKSSESYKKGIEQSTEQYLELEEELKREKDRSESHRKNVADLREELKTVKANLETRIHQQKQDLGRAAEENNRLKNQMHSTGTERVKVSERRAIESEVLFTKLKQDLELRKLNGSLTNVQRNLTHCDQVLAQIDAAPMFDRQADAMWRQCRAEWLHVATAVQEIKTQVQESFERQMREVQQGTATLASLPPVYIPGMPTAPVSPPMPQRLDPVVGNPVVVNGAVPPGFSPEVNRSSDRSTPADSTHSSLNSANSGQSPEPPAAPPKQLSSIDRLVLAVQQRLPNVGKEAILRHAMALRNSGQLKGKQEEVVQTIVTTLEPKIRIQAQYNPAPNNVPRPRRASSVESNRDLECPVCHEYMFDPNTGPQPLSRCPECRHQFHAECVNEWLQQHKRTCPMCVRLWVPESDFPQLG